MKLSRQVLKIFGLKKLPVPHNWHLAPDENPTLSYLGYPTLVVVDFFFPHHAMAQWRMERTIVFPDKCCVCLSPARLYLPVYAYSKWLGRRQEQVLDQVPHCEKHGHQEEAKLIALANPWTHVVVRIALIGLNKAFLDETRDLNQKRGDVFPPWKAFPEYYLFHPGWRQGNGEYWLTSVWKPFWLDLSEAEQEQYLNRWRAPEDWRNFMLLKIIAAPVRN